MVLTDQVPSVSFDSKSGVVTIFGSRGMRFGGDARWAISFPGGHALTEIDANSTTMLAVAQDLIHGHSDETTMLVVSPRTAVLLYLERAFTGEQLERGLDDLKRKKKSKKKASGHIDIPDVMIGDVQLTLRVIEDDTQPMTLANKRGELIPA